MSGVLSSRRHRVGGLDWTALGCRVRLVITDPSALDDALAIATQELAAIDGACSRFRDDAEICRLDRSAGEPVRISPLLAEAIGVALDAAAQSDGDLDPTIGNAMADLGYDRDFDRVAPIGPAVRLVRRPAPGWRRIELDRHDLTVRVPSGVRLDLGATAKALAADRIAARASRSLSGCGVLIGIGGDLAIGGPAPADGWAVRVQDVTGLADQAGPGPTATVAVHSGGLATSSVAARHWVRGDRLLHHILDPRTCAPVDSPWRTVSVAAPTCVAANVASTVAIIRGARATSWLNARRVRARLVDRSGLTTVVGGWPADQPEQVHQ